MVNLQELRKEIRSMTTRKRLFHVLKKELSVLGYWRNKPRGNPEKGYEASKNKSEGRLTAA